MLDFQIKKKGGAKFTPAILSLNPPINTEIHRN